MSQPTLGKVRVFAGVTISVVGGMSFLVLPLFLGAMVTKLDLTETQVGFVSSAVLLGIASAGLSSLYWVSRTRWRTAALTGLALMFSCHVLSTFVNDIFLFGALQCLAGFGGGAAYCVMLTFFANQDNPDRCFGYSVASQVTMQVVGLLILPPLIDSGGLSAVLLFFIVSDTIGLLLVFLIPNKKIARSQGNSIRSVLNLQTSLTLAGCFLFFMNVGVFWTYIQRIGVATGLGETTVGFGLSLAVGIGILGAVTATILGSRFGRIRPLAGATVAIVVAMFFIQLDMSIVTYVAAVAVYKFCWNYSLTYQYGSLNAVDVSGKAVAMAPAFHIGGATLGPAVVAPFVTVSNYSMVNIVSAVSVVASLLCFFYANKLTCRSAQTATRNMERLYSSHDV